MKICTNCKTKYETGNFCKNCGKDLFSTNVVFEVKPNSEAYKVGIQKGDKIVAINGKKFEKLDDVVIQEGTNEYSLLILRKGIEKEIKVTKFQDILKTIVFEPETLCHTCGAKQKSGKGLIIGIILGIVIFGVIGIIVVNTPKTPNSSGVGFDSGDPNNTEENYGEENLEGSDSPPFYYNNNYIALNKAGQLSKNEKNENIKNLDKEKEKNTGNKNQNVSFDDEDPIGTNENYGGDYIEKSYSINPNFDIRNAIIYGYDFANMTSDKLRNILKQKAKDLGPIYFPYGFPKEHEMDASNTSIDISVRNLLANIPQAMLPNAKFLISGHTDTTYYKNKGTDRSDASHIFNQALSERRAEYVKQIMIGYGIKSDAIVTEGHSFDNLAATPDDAGHEENQKMNRRVEIKVAFDE